LSHKPILELVNILVLIHLPTLIVTLVHVCVLVFLNVLILVPGDLHKIVFKTQHTKSVANVSPAVHSDL
jgi:hypothetical protein